jgi:hypothetical protein
METQAEWNKAICGNGKFFYNFYDIIFCYAMKKTRKSYNEKINILKNMREM